MSFTDTDRRRLIAATVLTLVALPALWWANTSERSSAPNLAVAGVDPGIDARAGATESPSSESASSQSNDSESAGSESAGSESAGSPVAAVAGNDGLDGVAPVFLEGPTSAAGASQNEIAIPSRPLVDRVTAKATFRSTVPDGTCIVAGLSSGIPITVVNLDNDRSMTCTTILAPGTAVDELVMPTSAFATIADLTDAPISVEIRR
jgi:hypothetical protein